MKQYATIGCYIAAGICMLFTFYNVFQYIKESSIEHVSDEIRKSDFDRQGDILKRMFISSMMMAFFCLSAMFMRG